jgi:hypothetical protein
MQVMTQEVGTRLLAAQLEHGTRHIVIGQTVQIVYAPATVNVGDGFYIKHQNIHKQARIIFTEKHRWSNNDRRDRK